MSADATTRELQRLHLVLGELSMDPTLHFLLRIALRVTEERSSFTLLPRKQRDAVVARIRESHLRIIEAIVERNEPLAERRLRRYLSALKDWIE